MPFRVTHLTGFLLVSSVLAESPAGITFDNTPLGTRERPLVLRDFHPDPGLGKDVLSHHHAAARARKYLPGKGDVDGHDEPIRGLAGAIGVNFGTDLSICWDTVECRLLYAWTGGFLDMTNYWGPPQRGNRKGFGYVPELEGTLVYVAEGSSPLRFGRDLPAGEAPKFLGYALRDSIPEFHFRQGEFEVFQKISPGTKPGEIVQSIRVKGPLGDQKADYVEPSAKPGIERATNAEFLVKIQGVPRATIKSTKSKIDLTRVSLEAGEDRFNALGCSACHSLDGTLGHGPTLKEVASHPRQIEGVAEPVTATDAYLRESIQAPNAKIVKGFPPNYMPPYSLTDAEYQSLVIYLKSLND